MDAGEIAFGDSEQTQRIRVAQVGLRAERQARQPVEPVGRRDAAQPLAIDVVRIAEPVDERAQALELQRFQRTALERLELRLEDGVRDATAHHEEHPRETPQEPGDIVSP